MLTIYIAIWVVSTLGVARTIAYLLDGFDKLSSIKQGVRSLIIAVLFCSIFILYGMFLLSAMSTGRPVYIVTYTSKDANPIP